MDCDLCYQVTICHCPAALAWVSGIKSWHRLPSTRAMAHKSFWQSLIWNEDFLPHRDSLILFLQITWWQHWTGGDWRMFKPNLSETNKTWIFHFRLRTWEGRYETELLEKDYVGQITSELLTKWQQVAWLLCCCSKTCHCITAVTSEEISTAWVNTSKLCPLVIISFTGLDHSSFHNKYFRIMVVSGQLC